MVLDDFLSLFQRSSLKASILLLLLLHFGCTAGPVGS